MKWSIEAILLIAAIEFFNNSSSVKHNRSEYSNSNLAQRFNRFRINFASLYKILLFGTI